MSIDDDILSSYALGHLTPDEEAKVENHLQTHPEDAAQVMAYLENLAAFVLTLTPEALPDGAEAALLARVREARFRDDRVAPGTAEAAPLPPVVVLPARKNRRTIAWWLAGLSAAAVATGVYVAVLAPVEPSVRSARELRRYEAEAGAVSYALTQEGRSAPLGTLVRLQDGRVFVALAKPPAAPQVYQAWAIADAPVSLGTFSGYTFLSDEAVAAGVTFGLTLEPPGGSAQPTSTPLTLLEL